MQLLIALIGILAYIDNVRSGFRTRSTFGWGRRREGANVSSSSLFFTHMDRRQRPPGLAPCQGDQVRGRRRASSRSDRRRIRNAIASEAARFRGRRKTHDGYNSVFQEQKCPPISRKRVQLGRIAVGRPRSEDGPDGASASSNWMRPRLGARRQLRDAQKAIELSAAAPRARPSGDPPAEASPACTGQACAWQT
jgi:hypothetical protein